MQIYLALRTKVIFKKRRTETCACRSWQGMTCIETMARLITPAFWLSIRKQGSHMKVNKVFDWGRAKRQKSPMVENAGDQSLYKNTWTASTRSSMAPAEPSTKVTQSQFRPKFWFVAWLFRQDRFTWHLLVQPWRSLSFPRLFLIFSLHSFCSRLII